MIKNALKKFSAYVLIYLGLVILFTTLMYGTYSLPDTNIRGHIAESIPLLKNEGIGYAPFFQTDKSTLDTFTDELILNIATNKSPEESTLKKSLENSYYFNGDDPSLSEGIQDANMSNHEYSRYWHGVQVFIRPLLLFFNYPEIRYILMLVIFGLLAIVFSMIGKQVGIRYSVIFAIVISMMYIVIIPMSIQYSSIFIVTLVSIIALLLLYKKNKEKYVPMLFFVIGAFSTFFDLLTYPLITLGIPVALAVILQNRKGMTLGKQIIFIIKLGILWAIGYGLLFFSKWLIATIVLQKDLIKVALDNILFRVNGNDTYPVNRLDTVRINFEYFFSPIAQFIMKIFIVGWIILFVFYRKKIKDCKTVIPLLCIAIVPYIWYILFAGHSTIHCWFTNKIQAITVFALLCAMGETINKKRFGRFIKMIKEKNKITKIRRETNGKRKK